MNLVFILDNHEGVQTGDLIFSQERMALEPITVLAPGTVKPEGFPVLRTANNFDILENVADAFKGGKIAHDTLKEAFDGTGVTMFTGQKDLLKYVAENFNCAAVFDEFSDDEVLEAAKERLPGTLENLKGENGASFHADDCRDLISQIVERQGWDVIYNRIRDLNPMEPSGPGLFSDLDAFSVKPNS